MPPRKEDSFPVPYAVCLGVGPNRTDGDLRKVAIEHAERAPQIHSVIRDDQSQLLVRVNDEFVIDAGTCVDAPGETRAIQPPATTMFRQLLEYLKSKPDPDSRVLGSRIGREGIAATAMTLRWGSYLAVLLDREKSVWPEVKSTGISRISDGEMARINPGSQSKLFRKL